MRVDVPARAALAVSVEPVPEALQQLHDRPAGKQRRHRVMVDAEQQQERREIRRIPFPGDVGLGEADVAAFQEPAAEAEVVDDDLGLRPGLRSGEAIAPPVRQLRDEAAMADLDGIAEGARTKAGRSPAASLRVAAVTATGARRAAGGVGLLIAILMRCSPVQDRGSSRARSQLAAARVSRRTRCPSTTASWPRYGCPLRL